MITGETPGERTKCQKACQNETQIDPHPLGHCPAEKSTKRKSAAFRRWPSSRQESLRRFSTGVRLKNSPSKASKGSALFPVTGKPSKSCFEFQAEFSQETPMIWTRVRGKRVVVVAVWGEPVSGALGAISLISREITGNFFKNGPIRTL